jgi:hypothetical protein
LAVVVASEEDIMDARLLTRVLWLRRVLRQRERWTREVLEAHQRRELAALR